MKIFDSKKQKEDISEELEKQKTHFGEVLALLLKRKITLEEAQKMIKENKQKE